MTKDEIKTAAEKFCGWKLPTDFNPDCYISIDREKAFAHPYHGPTGTNLFTFEQAKEMFESCIGEALAAAEKRGAEAMRLKVTSPATQFNDATQLQIAYIKGLGDENLAAPQSTKPRTFPDGTFTFDSNDFLYQKGLHHGRTLHAELSEEDIEALTWHLSATKAYEEYTHQESLVVTGYIEFARAVLAAQRSKK